MITFYGLMKIKQIYLTWSTQLTYFFSYQYYFLRKKKNIYLASRRSAGAHLISSK